MDIPVFKEVIASTFRKEPELKDLKSQLDLLNRQINLSLGNKENIQEEQAEKNNKSYFSNDPNISIPDISNNSINMSLQDNKGFKVR